MFDSGFGGLTVARAVIDLLPAEDLVYVGDTGRYPYGPRPLDEVLCFARQITSTLVSEHDVKLEDPRYQEIVRKVTITAARRPF